MHFFRCLSRRESARSRRDHAVPTRRSPAGDDCHRRGYSEARRTTPLAATPRGVTSKFKCAIQGSPEFPAITDEPTRARRTRRTSQNLGSSSAPCVSVLARSAGGAPGATVLSSGESRRSAHEHCDICTVKIHLEADPETRIQNRTWLERNCRKPPSIRPATIGGTPPDWPVHGQSATRARNDGQSRRGGASSAVARSIRTTITVLRDMPDI